MFWTTFSESQLSVFSLLSAERRMAITDLFFFTAFCRDNPSLLKSQRPMRDVGSFVGVEKPLQFFIVPLK